MFLSFTGICLAVTLKPVKHSVVVPSAPLPTPTLCLIGSTEITNSTSYTKNKDGTINKIEQITRTTIIKPSDIVSQISNLDQEKTLLSNQKAVLDAVK